MKAGRLAVAMLALVPVAAGLPALAALGMVAAVLVPMISTEVIRYADITERIRHEEEARA